MENTSGPVRARLEVAAPTCVADDFGEEVVALNLDTGFYFSLRGLAGAIWRDLAAGSSREDLAAALSAIDADLASAANHLVDQLLEQGLVRAATAAPDTSRDLMAVGVAASGSRSIELETFNDMKTLILADPIHEADEDAGWPVLRAKRA